MQEDAFFRKAFDAVDKNGDGILSLDEIQNLASVGGIQITQDDIAEFKKIIGCPCRGLLKDMCVYQVGNQRCQICTLNAYYSLLWLPFDTNFALG